MYSTAYICIKTDTFKRQGQIQKLRKVVGKSMWRSANLIKFRWKRLALRHIRFLPLNPTLRHTTPVWKLNILEYFKEMHQINWKSNSALHLKICQFFRNKYVFWRTQDIICFENMTRVGSFQSPSKQATLQICCTFYLSSSMPCLVGPIFNS